MIKTLRKTVACLLTLCMVAMLCPVMAQDIRSDPVKCVKDYFASMGNDWDTVVNLTNSLDRDNMRALVNNEQSQKSHAGDLNIKSAKVTDLVEIDYTDPIIYPSTYGDEFRFGKNLTAFVVQLTLDVYKESQYYRNGPNIYLAVLHYENNEWKMASFGIAPTAVIEKLYPEATRTEEQNKILKLGKLLDKHLIAVNWDGKIVDYSSVQDLRPYNKFESKHKYTAGMFSDLNENAWYGSENEGVIKEAYELSILNGMGNGTMVPEGDLTIAQAIKIADVVHSIFNGKTLDFESTLPWYDAYVQYALENQIITEEDGFDYNANATRAQVAYIFSNAVSKDSLCDINENVSIADVDKNTAYADSIILLYEAGVLKGNDADGTFAPDNDITRAEAAAIIMRIVQPENRIFVM